MRYELVEPKDLEDGVWTKWRDVQRSNPDLRSPFFCPELLRCVAAVRDDVRVCVLEESGMPAGFFVFHRGRLGLGGPAAGRLSDHQGVIAPADLAWNVPDLLRASRLVLWRFDHLIAGQRPFAPHHRAVAPSPTIDVSRGFESYCRRLRAAGSHRISQLSRKARKLEREVGPLRFDSRTDDPSVLRTIITRKSEQCRRTGAFDFFTRSPWTRALVERIAATRTPRFEGIVSALWAGDRLAAAHFGMCSERVLHWWFPVYDRSLARYSPGAILLLRVVELAAARRLDLVDLGKGDDAYKSSFADGQTLVAEGVASRHAILAGLPDARDAAAGWLRTSPMAAPLRPALRAVHRWIGQRVP